MKWDVRKDPFSYDADLTLQDMQYVPRSEPKQAPRPVVVSPIKRDVGKISEIALPERTLSDRLAPLESMVAGRKERVAYQGALGNLETQGSLYGTALAQQQSQRDYLAGLTPTLQALYGNESTAYQSRVSEYDKAVQRRANAQNMNEAEFGQFIGLTPTRLANGSLLWTSEQQAAIQQARQEALASNPVQPSNAALTGIQQNIAANANAIQQADLSVTGARAQKASNDQVIDNTKKAHRATKLQRAIDGAVAAESKEPGYIYQLGGYEYQVDPNRVVMTSAYGNRV